MLIDESLAKGFTKQFISLLDDDLLKAKALFAKKVSPSMFTSRNGFNKVVMIHQEIFKKFTLSYHVGGSKRQPYIGFVRVVTTNNRDYKEWVESGIFGLTTTIPLSPLGQIENPQPSLFFIGEHAISRIFQRSQIFKQINKIDPYLITSEMKLIPFWSSFWVRLLEDLSMISDEKKSLICPVIPSSNGLFFCKLTNIGAGYQFVEIRTYVHESSLTDSQKLVRNMLLKASKNIENSIFCLYPHFSETPSPEFSRFEFIFVLNLILGRMRNETYQLCETVLPQKNVCDIYELDQNIKEVMKDSLFTESMCNNCNEILNSNGYRFWMSEMQTTFSLARKTSNIKL